MKLSGGTVDTVMFFLKGGLVGACRWLFLQSLTSFLLGIALGFFEPNIRLNPNHVEAIITAMTASLSIAGYFLIALGPILALLGFCSGTEECFKILKQRRGSSISLETAAHQS